MPPNELRDIDGDVYVSPRYLAGSTGIGDPALGPLLDLGWDLEHDDLEVTWNHLRGLRSRTGTHGLKDQRYQMVELREKWPILGRHEQAAAWLQVWQDLGRAPRTIDAYARGLAEYLELCERESVDPAQATRAHVALHVRELSSRPSRRGVNVVALDSGAGLSNATLQQRLVSVRLFYDFLVEEGLRQDNPVGRGRYTPGARGGGQHGLVRRLVKLPGSPATSSGGPCWR